MVSCSKAVGTIAFALLLLAPAEQAAGQVALSDLGQANVVSWSPNDVQPGEPVSVVLRLHELGPESDPEGGGPIAGADVAVVIRGDGETHRFSAGDLGGGRYAATILFPTAGGWDLGVDYGSGETQLAKGALCVGYADCAAPAPARAASPEPRGEPWTALAVALGGVVALTVLAAVVRARRSSRLAGFAEAREGLVYRSRPVP